jgi:hypothetical protein
VERRGLRGEPAGEGIDGGVRPAEADCTQLRKGQLDGNVRGRREPRNQLLGLVAQILIASSLDLDREE